MLSPTQETIESGARIFERALFLIAFLALGYVAWIELDRRSFQSVESTRLSPIPAAVSASRSKQQEVAVDGVIGRLSIPQAKIDAVIAEGVDDRTLRRAIGHVPHTALPGQPGNVALAAHRDTFFRGLGKLKLADPIQLVTPKGTYDYVVEDLRVVEPTDIEVLAPGPTPTLTLVTCYPFNYIGSAPQRFIVRAREVGPAPTVPPNVDPDRL